MLNERKEQDHTMHVLPVMQANTTIPANSWGQYVAAMIEYFNVTGAPTDLAPPVNSSQVLISST